MADRGGPSNSVPASALAAELQADREPPACNQSTADTGKLEEAAERVGSMVGTAMSNVRELPQRLAELKQRFTVIRGRASENASAAASEWKETARHQLRMAKSRVQIVADEYPVHVILGAAMAAFAIGLGLRIWRSSRD
jgi:hypothetical protein